MWMRAASLALVVTSAEAHADELPLTELPDHVTEARLVVDAPPAAVYDFVTTYASWPSILSDISSVAVGQGGREHARVTFRSRSLGHTVTVVFDNVPGRLIRFEGVKGPPGGRARGEYTLTPIDNGRRTQVTARLYMDVVGAPGLFVRDSTVRDMRRAKLRADVSDVARHFQQAAATSARP
jgi:uncharacterized membrane protein